MALAHCTGCGEAGEPAEPLPLVEIAAIGGLSPAEPCYVVLHELAHVLALGFGSWPGMALRGAPGGVAGPAGGAESGRAGGLESDFTGDPQCAAGDSGADRACAGGLLLRLAPPWLWRAGHGTRGGTSRGEGAGSRYLKVICRQPGCGYQVRVTRKWLALGAPRCPRPDHGDLVLERTTPAG